MTNQLKERLIKQLMLHEGERLKPYTDSVGKTTIGIGRNLTDRGISKETSRQMLEEDILDCWTDLNTFKWFNDLDDIRKSVLLDLRFNLGPYRFRGFKNTLKAVSEGRWEDASKGMLSSLWARQTKSRAVRLAKMMKDGVDYA